MIDRWQVSLEESGMNLLAFLKKRIPHYSARALKKALENNCCQINGKTERFASASVGKGDKITLSLLESNAAGSAFDPKRVLDENADLLFYDKPSGHSSDDQFFLRSIQEKYPTAELLHRLDKETTGVLMFAKSEDVRQMVIGYFRKHLVKKTYYALVDGVPKKKSGLIDNYLGRKRIYQGQAIWGEVKPHEGLHAVTAWERERAGGEASLLRCFPKTGRTHQLRVHLSGLGHPILGDFQYGRHFLCKYRAPRCLLHAAEIEFEHPAGNLCTVSAPLPKDFLIALEELKCAF